MLETSLNRFLSLLHFYSCHSKNTVQNQHIYSSQKTHSINVLCLVHPCARCCNTGHISPTYALCYYQNIKHVAISLHLTTKIYKPLSKSVAINQSQKQVEIGSVYLDYTCVHIICFSVYHLKEVNQKLSIIT